MQDQVEPPVVPRIFRDAILNHAGSAARFFERTNWYLACDSHPDDWHPFCAWANCTFALMFLSLVEDFVPLMETYRCLRSAMLAVRRRRSSILLKLYDNVMILFS